jgi:Double-GTPase 1
MIIVPLGEQATGKSSLLVALYGALVNHRAGELRIVRTVDNVAFLSRGLQAFGRRESVRRTPVDSDERLVIELARGDQTVTLELPDHSGELLQQMLDERVWDRELHRQIGAAAGALLFLRAERVRTRELDDRFGAPVLSSVERFTGHEPDDRFAAPPFRGYGELDAPAHPIEPTPIPADARAVDLLQEILEERSDPFPVAVVVSAWDRVNFAHTSPASWLADQAPLLEQFLASNSRQLPHAVFGVSAQGGEFGDGSESLGDDPWDAAFAVGQDGLRGTLEEPFLWLLDAARR